MATETEMTGGHAQFPGRSGDTSIVQALIWLALFAGVVALLGGSSRFDAVQAAALRPLVALFLIPALYMISREKLNGARAPMVILGLIALWTALQLVPLPPAIWQALPGRETITRLDALNGIEGTWRPISYVPMRGWNALFGLVVPCAAALLALALRPGTRALLFIIVGLGVADAALGLLQVLSGRESPLYFYAQTNLGAPVGLFANENHSGVFSAMILLAIARLGFGSHKSPQSPLINLLLVVAFVIVTLAVLVSGSRAALGVGAAAIAAAAVMGWLWFKRPQLEGAGAKRFAILARHPRWLLVVGLSLVAALLYALMQFERAPGVIDAFNQSAIDDLRWRIGPILRDMLAAHWLVGSGFGTFDAVYQIYEPTALMTPSYLNQAHNDWAQLVIEGGLPAIILVVALGRWVLVSVRSLYAREPAALARCVFWTTMIAIVAIASLFDYPLRTPIFQLVGVWLIVALASDVRERKAVG